MVASLILNILFVIGLLVSNATMNSGSLDQAQINYGLELMCSDEYRDKIKNDENTTDRDVRLSLLDYTCSNNGAAPYFENGYKEYSRSLGLEQ